MSEKVLLGGLTILIATLATLAVFSSTSDSIETTGEQRQAGGVEGLEESRREELIYYAQQGPMTDPRQYADIFDSLPTDIPALCKIIRGFLLHTFNAPYYVCARK